MRKDKFQVPYIAGLSSSLALDSERQSLQVLGGGGGVAGQGRTRSSDDASDMCTFSLEDQLPLAMDCM